MDFKYNGIIRSFNDKKISDILTTLFKQKKIGFNKKPFKINLITFINNCLLAEGDTTLDELRDISFIEVDERNNIVRIDSKTMDLTIKIVN